MNGKNNLMNVKMSWFQYIDIMPPPTGLTFLICFISTKMSPLTRLKKVP
jgi:hypothetical protein